MSDDKARARQLYYTSAQRAANKAQQSMGKARGKGVLITNPDEVQIIEQYAKSVFWGYTLSGVGGFALARYLANPVRTNRYRPGLLGQAVLTLFSASVGGLVTTSARAPRSIGKLIGANGPTGQAVCETFKEMAPCIHDAKCREYMSHGRSRHVLEWYETCMRRSDMQGGAGSSARTQGDNQVDNEFGQWSLSDDFVSDDASSDSFNPRDAAIQSQADSFDLRDAAVEPQADSFDPRDQTQSGTVDAFDTADVAADKERRTF